MSNNYDVEAILKRLEDYYGLEKFYQFLTLAGAYGDSEEHLDEVARKCDMSLARSDIEPLLEYFKGWQIHVAVPDEKKRKD